MIFRKRIVKEVDSYSIKIGRNIISLPAKIRKILELKNNVLITLDTNEDCIKEPLDVKRNIFCYDKDGNFLWQIQPTPYSNDSYLGAVYNEELDKVYVFSHTRHDVDLKTGNISNKTETR